METNKKINPQVVRSKKWLTESLLTLMTEKAYDKISIAEIVSRADLSRFAFYHHYKTKDDILTEYIDHLFVAHIDKPDKVGRISWFESTRRFVSIFEENDVFFKLLAQNNLVQLLQNSQIKNYSMILEQYLGRPTKLSGDEYDYYVTYYSAASIGVMVKWITKENRESPDEIAKILCKLKSDSDSSIL